MVNNDTSNIINNNNDNTYDTSYIEPWANKLPMFVVPNKENSNRENRRKELKKKTGNPHELNIGRISVSNSNIICSQKEKKKNFNEFIKGKVK